MPYNDPDGTDPMELNGVAIETDAETERESVRAMAVCFAEEFVRMGFEPERIKFLFESPVYHGPQLAHRMLGAQEVGRIIEQAMRVFRPGYAARTDEAT